MLFEGRPAGTDDLHLRRQVTLLLQTPYLLSRSVASNVAYGLRVRGIRNASAMSFPAGNASVWPSQPVWPCAPGFF